MKTHAIEALFFMIVLTCQVQGTDPLNPGKVTWAKGYPRVTAIKQGEMTHSVEVKGDVESKDGWTLKEVKISFSPKSGGELSQPTSLKFTGGKWGEIDPANKSNVIPAKVPIAQGDWNVWVVFVFDGSDAEGKPTTVSYLAAIKSVEVK